MYPNFNPYGIMPMPYQPPRPALPQQQVVTVSETERTLQGLYGSSVPGTQFLDSFEHKNTPKKYFQKARIFY